MNISTCYARPDIEKIYLYYLELIYIISLFIFVEIRCIVEKRLRDWREDAVLVAH